MGSLGSGYMCSTRFVGEDCDIRYNSIVTCLLITVACALWLPDVYCGVLYRQMFVYTCSVFNISTLFNDSGSVGCVSPEAGRECVRGRRFPKDKQYLMMFHAHRPLTSRSPV